MSLKLLDQLMLDPVKAYQTTDIEDFKYLLKKTMKRLDQHRQNGLLNSLALKYSDMNYETFVTYLRSEGAAIPKVFDKFGHACKNGDTKLMEIVLEELKYTPDLCIHMACVCGHVPIIEMLLEHFKDKGDVVDLNEGLRGAAFHYHYDATKLLLSKGATLWHEGFIVACHAGDIQLADDMISHMIPFTSRAWEEGFNLACRNNHLPLVQHMLNIRPADFPPCNSYTLCHALCSGNEEIIRLVKNMPVCDGIDTVHSYLIAACETGNMALFNIAVASNPTEDSLLQGFMHACRRMHIDIANLLIPNHINEEDIAYAINAHIYNGDLYALNCVLDVLAKV